MRLPYDKTNENGDKIRNEPTDSGIKEVNMSAMFERPGRRTTSEVDILVYEALAYDDPEEEDPKNAAVPGSEEVRKEAEKLIERARERGLSAAEAIGAFDDETEDKTRQSFRDRMDARTGDPMTEAIREARAESVGGPQDQDGEDEQRDDHATEDETEPDGEGEDDNDGGGSWSAANVYGEG